MSSSVLFITDFLQREYEAEREEELPREVKEFLSWARGYFKDNPPTVSMRHVGGETVLKDGKRFSLAMMPTTGDEAPPAYHEVRAFRDMQSVNARPLFDGES